MKERGEANALSSKFPIISGWREKEKGGRNKDKNIGRWIDFVKRVYFNTYLPYDDT